MKQSSARRRPVQEPVAVNKYLVPGFSTVFVLVCYFLIDWSNPEMFIWKRLSIGVFVIALFVLSHITPRPYGYVNDSQKAVVITGVGIVIALTLAALFGFNFSHFGVFLGIWILVVLGGSLVAQKVFNTDYQSALMIFGGAILGSLGIAIVFLSLISRMV